MNYTIHLTNDCNMNCAYCYERKDGQEISFENIKSLIGIIFASDQNVNNINFYGGEPCLRKEVIYDTIEYIKTFENKDKKFSYTLNTNGTLLDDKFIDFCKQNKIIIGYSMDGIEESHNRNRVTKDNQKTFLLVEENAKKVLARQAYSIAMLTVTLNNVEMLYENVQYLYEIGFKKVLCALDFLAKWTETEFEKLAQEYEKLANLYYEKTKKGDQFYLEPLDSKMDTYIKGKKCSDTCQLGKKSVNIGTDGNIYPCLQFVGKEEYVIGNCKDGIDREKQMNLMKNSGKESESCSKCKINSRCRHTCGCLNLLTSGNINMPSPLICEYERMTINIADKLAELLYNEKVETFIKKKYKGDGINGD